MHPSREGLIFIATILVLCTLGSSEPQTCDDLHRWIDANYASVNGTGSREDPFRSIEQAFTWLNELPAHLGCQAYLHAYPGVYHTQAHRSDVDLTLDKCLDCPNDPITSDKVIIEATAAYFLFVNGGSLTISNITISGASIHQPAILSVFSILGSESATFNNVTFTDFYRHWTIIYAEKTNITFTDCLIENNHVEKALGTSNSLYVNFLDSRKSHVTLRDTIVRYNSLIVTKYMSSSTAALQIGTTIVSGGDGTLAVLNCEFLNNSIFVLSTFNSSTDSHTTALPSPSKTYYGGALLLHFVSLHATISRSTFAHNAITINQFSDLTGGAAIGAKTGIRLEIIDTNFIENSADIGGALISIEEGGRFGDLALIHIEGGLVRGHVCKLRGCGFAFHASLVEQTVTISGVLFEDNFLSFGFLHGLNDPMDLSGGAAVAFLVDYLELPVDVSLVITRCTFLNNSISGWSADLLGGGRALATFQVAEVAIFNSTFSGAHQPHRAISPVIWLRWFQSIVFDNIQVYNFSTDAGSIDETLVDLRFATPVFNREWPLIISNWDLVDCFADSIFKISDMSRALFQNVTFRTTNSAFLISVSSRIFDVEYLSERLDLRDIRSFSAGVIVVAGVPEVRIDRSLFEWRVPSRFKRHLEVTDVSELFISNSIFKLNDMIAGVSAPLSTVEISNVTFDDASIRDGSGAALYAVNSIVTIRDCVFTDSLAEFGSAVTTSGPLVIVGSTFIDSTGGFVDATVGPFDVRDSLFRDSWRSSNGGAIQFANENTPFVVSNCTFENNLSDQSGGAFYASFASYGVVEHSRFLLNEAKFAGGALHLSSFGATLIHNCSFEANKVSAAASIGPNSTPTMNYGGAIYARSQANITDSYFYENSAPLGGAVFTQSHLSIENSQFDSNRGGYGGGAIAAASSAFLFFGTEPAASNCTLRLASLRLVNNEAERGGALFVACDIVHWTASYVANNFANSSGGAVFSAQRQNPPYSNLSFIDNTSKDPGGTFYYASEDLKGATTKFCSDPLECIISTNGTVLQPPWGPTKASAALSARISRINPLDLDLTAKNQPFLSTSNFASLDPALQLSSDPNTSTPFYLSRYLFEMALTDLYDQDANETYSLSGVATVQCLDSLAGCPFYVQVLPGFNALTIVLLGNSDTFYRPSALFSKSLVPTPTAQEREISLHINVKIEDSMSFVTSPLYRSLTLRGCPPGYGLTNFSDPAYSMCQPCPISSYNLDGDGYCYLCNDEGSHELECEGSVVSYREDNWMAPINGTNELLIEKCFLGFCKDGKCAPHRTGFLCGECVSGSFTSLLSECSPTICSQRHLGIFMVAFIAMAILTLALHVLLYRWSSSVMFFCLIAQLAMFIVSQGISWSLPRLSSSIADFLCGYRMTFMERSVWLTFGPYAALLVLALMWILVAAFSKIQDFGWLEFSKTRNLLSEGHMGDWKRVLSTATAILYINSSWTLSHAIHWLQCRHTVFGYVWLMQPSVHCDSHPFVKNRALYLSLSLPLIMLPMLSSFVAMIYRATSSLEGHAEDSSSKGMRSSRFRLLLRLHRFHASASSRLWPFIELFALKVAFPIVLSTLGQQGLIEAGATCIILLFAACTSSWSRPLSNKYVSAAGPFCALGIVAILKQDITGSTLPPLITTIVVIVLLFLLALALILGRSSDAADENSVQTSEKLAINASSSDDDTAPLLGY